MCAFLQDNGEVVTEESALSDTGEQDYLTHLRAMQCPVLTLAYQIACYATPGSDSRVPDRAMRIRPLEDAVLGAGSTPLSHYALAMPCPVLTCVYCRQMVTLVGLQSATPVRRSSIVRPVLMLLYFHSMLLVLIFHGHASSGTELAQHSTIFFCITIPVRVLSLRMMLRWLFLYCRSGTNMGT